MSPAQYQTVAGFSTCNLGDFIGLRKNFFPQTSGNHKMFFPDIQSYCMAGISLQGGIAENFGRTQRGDHSNLLGK